MLSPSATDFWADKLKHSSELLPHDFYQSEKLVVCHYDDDKPFMQVGWQPPLEFVNKMAIN